MSRERDLVRQETQHLRDNYHSSEQAAPLAKEEVEEANVQLSEARKSRYFHDKNERKVTENHRIAAESNRSIFEGPFKPSALPNLLVSNAFPVAHVGRITGRVPQSRIVNCSRRVPCLLDERPLTSGNLDDGGRGYSVNRASQGSSAVRVVP